MKKFNLITSSNIKLWNKTKTNLLVGDWCLLNLDKKKINKYKYKVLPYHWNNLKKKKKDIKYINKIIKIISRELVNFLNEYHNSNFSYGYWKILLFPWLYLWVGFVFDRWEIVKNIKNVKNLSQKFSNYDSKDFILNNSRSLIYLAQTNPWNEWIFSKILNFFNKENYNLKKKNLL